jgi:SAM-dependent methyltransferase
MTGPVDALHSPALTWASYLAGSGQPWDPAGPEAVTRISDATSTGASCRVLTVGCGTAGDVATVLGCDVIGVDLLPAVLSMAEKQRADGVRNDRRVRFVAATTSALPFRAERFDRVWCLGVATHVEDLPAFGREVCRVLLPGGVVALTEAFWDGIRAPRFARAAPTGWQALTADTLSGLLARSGLVDVVVTPWQGETVPGSPHARDWLLREDLADRRLAPHLVTARRP